jgi:hypothetical protein
MDERGVLDAAEPPLQLAGVTERERGRERERERMGRFCRRQVIRSEAKIEELRNVQPGYIW